MSLKNEIDGPTILLGVGTAVVVTAGLEYFTNKRKRILKIARGEIGTEQWHKYLSGVAAPPGGPVAWCGIFALWVLHQAGVGENVLWNYGSGFLYRLSITQNPKPGDLAYISRNQHHAIVEKLVGDQVQTIDGNSKGRRVARNVRPRSAFASFYSIQPLIDGEL